VVVCVEADVLEVVVLAAGADALLLSAARRKGALRRERKRARTGSCGVGEKLVREPGTGVSGLRHDLVLFRPKKSRNDWRTSAEVMEERHLVSKPRNSSSADARRSARGV
jgi:hypothetical protein